MRCRIDRALKAVVATGVVVGVMGGALPSALADETPESLFTEGRKLLKAGKTAEACDKLAASLEKFEARGNAKQTAAAMINLADCREQNQQLATAWSLFLRTATLAQNAGQRAVASEARNRAGLLQPRVSYLTIAIADPNRVEGLTIARDGQSIETALWNQGIPVDGGTYVVSASAPGNDEWSTKVHVPLQNGKVIVEIPRLKQLQDYAKEVAKTTDAPTSPSDDPDAASGYRFTALHWGGVGAAAAGVAAIGAGVYFGLQAGTINDEAEGWEMFMPGRFADGEDAERNSIIALSVGAVCVVGGGVLFYLGHRSNSEAAPDERPIAVTPWLSPEGAGVGAVGRF